MFTDTVTSVHNIYLWGFQKLITYLFNIYDSCGLYYEACPSYTDVSVLTNEAPDNSKYINEWFTDMVNNVSITYIMKVAYHHGP